MFAPITTAAVRSASQIRNVPGDMRETLVEAAHVAETLGDRLREGDGPEQGGDGGVTPREAEERIDAEYRPLLEDQERGHAPSDHEDEDEEGQSRRGRDRTTTVHHRSASYKQRLDRRGGEQIERKTRAVEVAVTYGCFFILGACILLAWNAEIVASSYFGARLKGSRFELSYSSWVALTFTSANLVFLAAANFTQHGANLGRRISISILVLLAVVALYIVSTQIKEIPTGLFMSALLVCTVVLAASASYLQNAVVALSASFGPHYLQGILSGQGAVAFLVSALQFIAAYTSLSAAAPSDPQVVIGPSTVAPQLYIYDGTLSATQAPIPEKGVRQAAFTFFLAIGIFAVVSLLSYILLTHIPLYRLVIRASEGDEEDDDGRQKSAKPSLRVVERKIRKLGISMFLVFGITLAVFPSITSTIVSVNEGKLPPGSGISETLTKAPVFLPVAFMMFAIGDWVGRMIPQIKVLTFTNWKALALLSAARIVFIPLFLMCNTSAIKGTPVINSDIAFLFIMLVFALTNGYASTLIMLAAVVEPSLEENEVDIAATCMAFYLTAGLAGGSFISFPIRAVAL